MSTTEKTAFEVRAADGPGAVASFGYDAATVERFRKAFPRARWSDELRAWIVPGATAERRLNRWFDREMPRVLAYADERGRDAFAFEPIQSKYLTVGEEFEIRTPFPRTIQAELREVPWAAWDAEHRLWRVPFRSWEDLRRRWPVIETAAARNEPEERGKRREAERGSPEYARALETARERRRHRHPVSADAVPPLDIVLMTTSGAIAITDVTGEFVDEVVARQHYPDVSTEGGPLIWATWRRPTPDELVHAWPSRSPPLGHELSRGWWKPTLDELRDERRKARSIERAQATRRQRHSGADRNATR
ncbi:hypothetical protein GCM10011611_02640 [Aliidongia dinghuensis]|uniref:HARP domain-containing protein n=1 Tax=Aliidongia dinghuensis TaxID=1867774 RepID=A0A8J2YPI8_9PROT|nr:hypothetical protein [Aliidongia dinghuensis]GGF00508.1 hypothetical protein GCM10011611_02640 [Aliidongia dinghuensis]